MRLDFGLTSPHHVNSTAAASSYGNLSVFNPRDDHLDVATPGTLAVNQPLSMTRFKNRSVSPQAMIPASRERVIAKLSDTLDVDCNSKNIPLGCCREAMICRSDEMRALHRKCNRVRYAP